MIYMVFLSVFMTSWVASIVILLILFLRRIMGNRLGIKCRQILWAIILFRLFLPYCPESPISLMNWIPSPTHIITSIIEDCSYSSNVQSTQAVAADIKEKPLEQNANNIVFYKQNDIDGINNAINTDPTVHPSYPIFEKLAYCWLAGVFLMLSVSAISVIRFRHIIRHNEQNVSTELVGELIHCKNILKINTNICLMLLPQLNSPILTGIFNSTIYLPEKLIEQTDAEDRQHILLHELVHKKKRDTLWNFFLLIVVSLHWFNPLVWVASQRIKEDREINCDAAVLELIGEDKAVSYGNAILQVVKFQNGRFNVPFYQTAFYANKKQTKRRIIMINKFHAGKAKKISSITLILCIILGITTLTNAPSYADKNLYNYDTPTKFQLFDPSYQYFDNLSQFCRYADFIFQLPNYLPSIFEVEDYRINRKNNQIILNVNYWYNTMGGAMVQGAEEEHFQLKISKTNLLKILAPQLTEEQKQKNTFIATYKSTDKVISGIKGTQLTIWIKDKEGYPSGGDNQYKEDRTQYFIWEKQGIWYAMEYVSEVTMENKSYYLLNLTENEVGRVISSFTTPKEITHKGYFFKKEMPSFAVYDETDLKRVSNDWNFSPRLLMELPGLKAKSARMSHVLYDNKEFGVFEVSYVSKVKSSTKIIAEYEQTTQPTIYESVEKIYQEQQNRALKTNETAYTLQTINGKNVYAVEEENKNTEKVHYFWDNGILRINGKLGDHTEVLKVLIK